MRLLLVEDNPELAASLKRALTDARFAVDLVLDGLAADAALQRDDYAILVLDVSLPRLSGWEVLSRLRKRGSKLPVLILTAHGSVEDRVKGLNLGADDYLAKPFDLTELEARLRALLRRSNGAPSADIQCGDLTYDSNQRRFSLGVDHIALPPREHAILEVLLLKTGKTVSKDQLLEQICNFDDTVSLEAIDIYIHRLRKKLENANVQIVTLRGLGYLLEQKNNG
ncbi:response regulator [Leeia sp. TBRC 13508]|uniref:Response regulator n=1 Tax=Leeia speluncae TaxID=2884804 RepID=A0ABS8D4N0_9NEIS|nr:response regulator [Leeia speluncae]MCB6183164.1 response regulator [Leeia speluncae]